MPGRFQEHRLEFHRRLLAVVIDDVVLANYVSALAVTADFLTPNEHYLTGNDVTVYPVSSLDLKVDGPTVVEIPPDMYGTANDSLFKYLTDIGKVGPDKGKGGR